MLDLLKLFVDNYFWVAIRLDAVLNYLHPRPITYHLLIIEHGPLVLRSFTSKERQVVTILVTDQTFYRVIYGVTLFKNLFQTKCHGDRYEDLEELHFCRLIIPVNVKKVHFGFAR